MRIGTYFFSLVLAGLTMAPAHGQQLQHTENKLGEIVQQFSSPYVRNPMFLCYHMGRLQSFADILALQIHQLSARQTSNPQKQALTIARGQQIHLKADRLLKGRTYDCDPQFAGKPPKPMENDDDLIPHIKAVRRKLRSIGGEDLVVGCFHTGRLSMLSGRLSESLRQQYAAGIKVESKIHTLLNASAKDVRTRSKRCKAQSIY
jgi:hypothetical protein